MRLFFSNKAVHKSTLTRKAGVQKGLEDSFLSLLFIWKAQLWDKFVGSFKLKDFPLWGPVGDSFLRAKCLQTLLSWARGIALFYGECISDNKPSVSFCIKYWGAKSSSGVPGFIIGCNLFAETISSWSYFLKSLPPLLLWCVYAFLSVCMHLCWWSQILGRVHSELGATFP